MQKKRVPASHKTELRKLYRELRREAGLKQKQVAERLGRPQSFVNKYELGDRRLDVLEIRDVCDVLGITYPVFVRRLEERLKGLEAGAGRGVSRHRK
jgi:transcriptional regulator with XRE-family HTH domain